MSDRAALVKYQYFIEVSSHSNMRHCLASSRLAHQRAVLVGDCLHINIISNSDMPSEWASPFSSMGEMTGDPKGVTKLLDGHNLHKAPGPDGLIARVIKE